jgi:hypothetical protein
LQALDSGVADITEASDSSDDEDQKEDYFKYEQQELLKASLDSAKDESITIDDADDQIKEDVDVDVDVDEDDGMMNVNVKERRKSLMQVINTQLLKTKSKQNATLKRLTAKNASIVKMAVQTLEDQDTTNGYYIDAANDATNDNDDHLETASIMAIAAASKVKLMVSKFDNPVNSVAAV